jgi:AcrR family transcriptional regulator
MGVQERRAREKEELRQEILAAARELFVTEGFENVSMRKIAEKIEYSPTTIYLYFQDKADLLDSVCEETLQKLESRLGALVDAVPDPVERLKAGLRTYIQFGLEHPNDYRVAFLLEYHPPLDAPERCLRCHTMGQQAFDHTRNVVTECVRAGRFGPLDVEATSQTLWAAAHGLTSLLILHPGFPWVERETLIERLIATLVEGLKCPAAEPAAARQ